MIQLSEKFSKKTAKSKIKKLTIKKLQIKFILYEKKSIFRVDDSKNSQK